MRFLPVLLFALSACSSSDRLVHWSDELADSSDLDVEELDIDPNLEEVVRTSELGTETTRDPAKSIEWQAQGTREGDSYLGGSIRIDRILRHDGDNFFGARVRLFNATAAPVTVEWKMVFLAANGTRVSTHADEWKQMSIEAAAWETLSDTSRVRGATSFRLDVRKPGQN